MAEAWRRCQLIKPESIHVIYFFCFVLLFDDFLLCSDLQLEYLQHGDALLTSYNSLNTPKAVLTWAFYVSKSNSHLIHSEYQMSSKVTSEMFRLRVD